MANVVSASFADRWSKRLQVLRLPTAVYTMIANYEERANLQSGDTVDRPYMTALYSKTLADTGAIARHDLTITSEKLTVNQKKEVSFFVQKFNEIQASIKFTDRFATHVGKVLINQIDGVVLGEYEQADSVIGEYEMSASGSSGDGIGFTLTTSNILKVFTKAKRKLNRLNIPQNDRWAVISGEFEDILMQYLAGKESALGDATGKNGNIGKYMNFKLFLSNACAWSGRLEAATLFDEASTVVVNGATFTTNATMSSSEGGLHLVDTATHCNTNFAAAINAPDTSITEAAGTGFTAFTTAAYLKALEGITATAAATYVTLIAEGKGYIAVSETLAAGADIWTTTKQLQHQLFGQGKPIDVVVQKYPNIEVQVRSGYVGRDFITWDLYGVKTFDEGDACLVDIQTRSDSY